MDICNEKWKPRGKDMKMFSEANSAYSTILESDYEEPDDLYYPNVSRDGRTVPTLDLPRTATFWPVPFGSHNASFSMELFSMIDTKVEPFKDCWIPTGFHLKYDKNLQGDFFVNFKGWRLTDKVVTRDRIIDITKNPSTRYDKESKEFQVNLLNFAPSPFQVCKGLPLGRLVLSSQQTDNSEQ